MPTLHLDEENIEAWSLWNLLSGQQNVGFGGKCGPLLFPSIQFVFEIYDIQSRREAFEKIQLIHNIYCRIITEKEDQKPDSQYCRACKAAKKDDCGKCDKNIYEVK